MHGGHFILWVWALLATPGTASPKETAIPAPSNPDWTTLARLKTNVPGINPLDSNCYPSVHLSWIRVNDFYRQVFDLRDTTYFIAVETCLSNFAALWAPDQQWKTNMELMQVGGVSKHPAWIGVSLPQHRDLSISCHRQECDKYLMYSTGATFQWEEWMGDSFNRKPHQPRCFQAYPRSGNITAGIRPSNCAAKRLIICHTPPNSCPKPGRPTQPMAIVKRKHRLPAYLYAQEHAPVWPEPSHQEVMTEKIPKDAQEQQNQTAIEQIQLQAEQERATRMAEKPIRLKKDPFEVEAYDCSIPQGMRTLQANREPITCAGASQPKEQRNQTYLLLQRMESIDMEGRLCFIRRTILPLYCGYNHHSILVPNFYRQDEVQVVTTSTCRDLWESMEYHAPDKKVYKLQEGINHIYYYHTGSYTNEASCETGTYQVGDKKYPNMVVRMSMKIEMRKVAMQYTTRNEMIVPSRSLTLPSHPTHGSCKTAKHGTFLWTTMDPDKTCRFAKLRVTKGISVYNQYNNETFMSNDQTMIRLQVYDSTSRCGHVVKSTNYDKLFVTEDLNADGFEAQLQPNQYSVITYVNMQDAYLHGHLTERIRQEFEAINDKDCHDRKLRHTRELDRLLANQNGATDGDTAHLGEGTFVTTVGETWYQYKCRRIQARVRKTSQCYASLPVTLYPRDALLYAQARNQSANITLELFMEPHSRKLTDRGVVTKCSTQFPALYRTCDDNWIQLLPHPTIAKPPQLLTAEQFHNLAQDSYWYEDLDFEDGGIYGPTDVKEMEQFLATGRVRMDIESSMATVAMDQGWSSQLFATMPDAFSINSDFFHHPGSLTSNLIVNPLMSLWDDLDSFALSFSKLSALYFCFQIIFLYLPSVQRRLCSPMRPNTRLPRHIVEAFIPAIKPTRKDFRIVGPRTFKTDDEKPEHIVAQEQRWRELTEQGPTAPRWQRPRTEQGPESPPSYRSYKDLREDLRMTEAMQTQGSQTIRRHRRNRSMDIIDTQVTMSPRGTMSVEKAGTPADKMPLGYHPSLQMENLIKKLEEAELDLQQRIQTPSEGSPRKGSFTPQMIRPGALRPTFSTMGTGTMSKRDSLEQELFRKLGSDEQLREDRFKTMIKQLEGCMTDVAHLPELSDGEEAIREGLLERIQKQVEKLEARDCSTFDLQDWEERTEECSERAKDFIQHILARVM